ncbi:hypothetical protein C2S51_036525 [Perilla frutescens var. frutescens]|nr:hypothetical protein C2S51_036525 [Perilla frutescens var. frutescens]
MNSRRVERGNLSWTDRLSSLPDSLLIGILCYLDLKEAVKTAVLSKQWRFVIIVVGRRTALNYFHVEFYYEKRFASDVDAWVGFAVRNKVENLSLLLDMTISSDEFRDYTLSSAWDVDWRYLTRLSLGRVRMSQQQLEIVISGCPVLESLEFNRCRGFQRLLIRNSSFRRLCVDRGAPFPRGGCRNCLREISAANMRELDVSMLAVHMNFRVTDAPALEQATIRIFEHNSELSPCHVAIDAQQLFQDICHVNKLHLEAYTAGVISMLVNTGFWKLPQFIRLKNLITYGANKHISGIIALLKSSPNLNNLVISCYNCSNNNVETHEASIQKVQIAEELADCDLLHLEFVDIAYFGITMVPLAQIILDRAPALVEMVIRNTSSSTTISHDFINKFQALLVYPKSSQKAKVVIHQ